jgi:hypothetical protein
VIAGVPVLAGIPVDNPANRAHAARHGAGTIAWPAPYPDSVTADCQQCGGQLYLGPELQRARTVLSDAAVLCLLCVALKAHAEDAEPLIISLSGDAEPGE